MNITELCYELYKIAWKRSHGVTPTKEMETVKTYFKDLANNEVDCTYNEYIEEFGYNGELYVCYDEFCDNEYLDDEYMCCLLKKKKLINLYLKDIEEV